MNFTTDPTVDEQRVYKFVVELGEHVQTYTYHLGDPDGHEKKGDHGKGH